MAGGASDGPHFIFLCFFRLTVEVEDFRTGNPFLIVLAAVSIGYPSQAVSPPPTLIRAA
jgi:hypothetical protein